MQLSTIIAIYFVLWWVTLFAILPIRVETQAEAGDIVPGSMASAPSRPMLWRKVLWTTCASALIFAVASVIHIFGGIGMDDILQIRRP